MPIDWTTCPAVEQAPARVSGAWVFRGTRVPVAALFENLEDDMPPHEFVGVLPGVEAAQVQAVIAHAANQIEHVNVAHRGRLNRGTAP